MADINPSSTSFCYPDPVALVHGILGVRASPDLFCGRTDSQGRMDHITMVTPIGEGRVNGWTVEPAWMRALQESH
jgi:hypothetical protein